MKIKFGTLCFSLLLVGHGIRAQSVIGDVPGKGLDIQTGQGGFVTQLPQAPAETKGDVYLNSEWAIADIKIYNQDNELKQLPIKIDLKSNEIEINAQNNIKILSGNQVEQLRITSGSTGTFDNYVNGKKYKLNGTPINGFIKIIDSAKWQLLIKPQLKLVQANYVAALDAGDRSDRWVKEEIYFFAKDSNLYRVQTSSKKFSQQFNEDAVKIQMFIKDNKINLKDQKDLQSLLTFLNENL